MVPRCLNLALILLAASSIKVQHNAGFFSCCSVKLHYIVEYFNEHKMLPTSVDGSELFTWYKPFEKMDRDITGDYFLINPFDEIPFSEKVDYHWNFQYYDYKKINYESLHPFINKYFSPSEEILRLISAMELKYNLIDYSNICVLFYRGNDKITETKLCGYSEFVEKGKFWQAENPNIRFLIQSDETEFIERMSTEFPGSFYFKDEIRHIKKSDNGQVDLVDFDFRILSIPDMGQFLNIIGGYRSSNNLYSKYYLAITLIMSKCKYIVCGTGNCSVWIMLYRNNANNVSQYLEGEWL